MTSEELILYHIRFAFLPNEMPKGFVFYDASINKVISFKTKQECIDAYNKVYRD